jgi:hypothetical protein
MLFFFFFAEITTMSAKTQLHMYVNSPNDVTLVIVQGSGAHMCFRARETVTYGKMSNMEMCVPLIDAASMSNEEAARLLAAVPTQDEPDFLWTLNHGWVIILDDAVCVAVRWEDGRPVLRVSSKEMMTISYPLTELDAEVLASDLESSFLKTRFTLIGNIKRYAFDGEWFAYPLETTRVLFVNRALRQGTLRLKYGKWNPPVKYSQFLSQGEH